MPEKLIKVIFIGPSPPPYSGPEIGMQQFLDSPVLNEIFSISFLKTNFRKDNTNKGKLDVAMVMNFVKYFPQLVFKLITSGARAVYYPVTPTQVGWLGRDAWTILLTRIIGKKIIIHLRGSHFRLNYQNFSPITKKIVDASLKRTNCAIVQAEYLRDQFAPFINKSKTEVLYQAIDTEELNNPDLKDYSSGEVLIVGHMTKAKGFTDVISLIPEIVDDFPETQFYFAGNIRRGERGVFYNQYTGESISYEDPVSAEVEIISGPYKANYHNLGIITGREKYDRFRKCQIFMSVSYSEGFSRSLLEAMAMGKPIIYTPVGAHREVLKDGVNGICVEPGNKGQIADALKRLLSDKELCYKIGRHNYVEAREKYDIQKIANDFKDIILHQLQ